MLLQRSPRNEREMNEAIPAQCPDCGTTELNLARVPPTDHDRGQEWVVHATCERCDEYTQWFE